MLTWSPRVLLPRYDQGTSRLSVTWELGRRAESQGPPQTRRSRICVYQALQAILSEQRSHASARLTPHCVLTGGKGLGAEGNGGTRRSPHSQGCSSVTSPERDSAGGRGCRQQQSSSWCLSSSSSLPSAKHPHALFIGPRDVLP